MDGRRRHRHRGAGTVRQRLLDLVAPLCVGWNAPRRRRGRGRRHNPSRAVCGSGGVRGRLPHSRETFVGHGGCRHRHRRDHNPQGNRSRTVPEATDSARSRRAPPRGSSGRRTAARAVARCATGTRRDISAGHRAECARPAVGIDQRSLDGGRHVSEPRGAARPTRARPPLFRPRCCWLPADCDHPS